MVFKKARGWCDICRDEKPDVTCIEKDCRKSFHIDCLQNTGQRSEDDDFSNYLCPSCRNNEENEGFCYKCKLEGDENRALLMCDGCPRSAHLECLELTDVPSSDIWMCPVCMPSQQKEKSIKFMHPGNVNNRSKLGNVDICYVCQKRGKLLCCQSCDQSFHPKCIDPEYLKGTLLDDGIWSCPICRGEDPLKNMGFKRMTRSERYAISREWQQCVRRESRRCRANRDQFLYEARAALRPFVSADTIATLKRNAVAAKQHKLSDKRIKKIYPATVAPQQQSTVTAKKGERKYKIKEEEEENKKRLDKEKEEEAKQSKKKFDKEDEDDDYSEEESSMEEEEDDDDEEDEDMDYNLDDELDELSAYEDIDDDGSYTTPCSIKSKKKLFKRKRKKLKRLLNKEPTPKSSAPDDDEEEEEDEGVGEEEEIDASEVQEDLESEIEDSKIEENKIEDNKISLIVSETADCSVLYQEEDFLREAEIAAAENKTRILREGVELKHYQRWGVNWLLDAFYHKAGAILADEMGLGKTIQTLAFLSALKTLEITGPHLVVVPLSTVGNWAREIRKFTSNLTVTKICGSRQEREHAMADGVAMDGIYDIYVTTYETAVTEEWFFTDGFKWQCVILDEAHRIKNESARIRHSLDRVNCNMRVLLTGTPLQNNIKELFTLLNFLFPDIIKNSATIEETFASNKKVANKQFQPTAGINENKIFSSITLDESKIVAVTALLSKLMLRRTKDLVVRLPNKIEHDIWLPLSPTAALWYRRLLEITTDIEDYSNSIRKLLGAVIKMRICCCHPRGLVSRDDQLKNLLETLSEQNGSPEELQSQAQKLRNVNQGWEHVTMSSKLMFLDKLLCHLHICNLKYSESYRQDFTTQRSNRLRKLIQDKKNTIDIMKKHLLTQNGSNYTELKNQLAKVKAELEALNKCEAVPWLEGEGNGGLIDGLVDDPKLLSDSNDFLAEHILPFDATPEQIDAFKNKKKLNIDTIRPHKVLVFTQFQLILDELSAYCQWRGWNYMRLDGSTNKMIRELDTREFNSPDSNQFVYLISTRAGGLGINLVTANHVVMYDEDWNPFVDLQAVDRAHRIGQVRNVHIWRLMLEWTVEERMAIRRQQKLKLDKLLIQANVETLDTSVSAEEKLSSDEIRRLIQYGKAALLSMSITNELEKLTLEEAIDRKRRDLKDVELIWETLLENNSSKKGDLSKEPDKKDIIDLQEVMRDVDCVSANTEDTSSKKPASDADKKEDEIETLAEHIHKRPKRERRKPKDIYNPTLQPDKFKSDIKLIREKKCFRCGGTGVFIHGSGFSTSNANGTGSSNKSTDKNNKVKAVAETSKNNLDILVGCMRCPKVYHLDSCLGLSKAPPRTWMCPWHECCLCFRRAASAGGLLIHCAECPTTFCFDCFPPEYRRYTPPPQFFEEFHKRGWMVSPQKLVTFLCSKCKALKEQERRCLLTKQQLDAEIRNQKSIDLSARIEARSKQQQSREKRMLAKESRRKQMDGRKKFLQEKKITDDQDKQLIDLFRSKIDLIYPKAYLDILAGKRQLLFNEQTTPLVPKEENNNEDSVKPSDDPSKETVQNSSENPTNEASSEHIKEGVVKEDTSKETDASKLIKEENSTDNKIITEQTSEPKIPQKISSENVEDKILKKETLVEGTDSQVNGTAKADLSTEQPQESKSKEDIIKKDPVEENSTTAENKNNEPPKEDATKSDAVKKKPSSKKRLIIPDRLKKPGDALKLCENCQFPLHDISTCPFPLELKKHNVEPPPPPEDSKPTEKENKENNDQNIVKDELNKEDKTTPVPTKIASPLKKENIIVPNEASTTPANESNDLEESKNSESNNQNTEENETGDQMKPKVKEDSTKISTPSRAKGKVKYRILCSLCLNASAIPHSRKHCELLTVQQKEEYKERREKYQKLIDALVAEIEEKQYSTKLPPRFAYLFQNKSPRHSISDKTLDFARKHFSNCADEILQRLMRNIGLEKCIPLQIEKKIFKLPSTSHITNNDNSKNNVQVDSNNNSAGDSNTKKNSSKKIKTIDSLIPTNFFSEDNRNLCKNLSQNDVKKRNDDSTGTTRKKRVCRDELTTNDRLMNVYRHRNSAAELASHLAPGLTYQTSPYSMYSLLQQQQQQQQRNPGYMPPPNATTYIGNPSPAATAVVAAAAAAASGRYDMDSLAYMIRHNVTPPPGSTFYSSVPHLYNYAAAAAAAAAQQQHQHQQHHHHHQHRTNSNPSFTNNPQPTVVPSSSVTKSQGPGSSTTTTTGAPAPSYAYLPNANTNDPAAQNPNMLMTAAAAAMIMVLPRNGKNGPPQPPAATGGGCLNQASPNNLIMHNNTPNNKNNLYKAPPTVSPIQAYSATPQPPQQLIGVSPYSYMINPTAAAAAAAASQQYDWPTAVLNKNNRPPPPSNNNAKQPPNKQQPINKPL